jgi:hypothetical protein
MRRQRYGKRRYYLPMLVATGLVLLAGKAAMASNTVPSSVDGYGTATISGATATSISYGTSADGATISSVTVVFVGDLTGKAVSAGFNSSALSVCTLGTFNAGANTTTAVCAGLAQNTATAATLAVAVHQ